MIRLKYIGKKPFAIDNITHSGTTWEGPGDVREVQDRTARALLAYPDQWALEDPKDAKTVAKEPVTAFLKPDGQRVVVPDSDLKKHLEDMTPDELRAYALRYYKKTLPASAGRKRLMDEIEELQRGMDPIAPQ